MRGDIGRRRKSILVLDHQPLVLFLRADQREGAFEFLATQQDAELAFLHALPDLALGLRAVMEPSPAFVRRVDAAVPDDHLARPVLPGRNYAFERSIVVGMVFHMHGEALFVTIERGPFGNRPRQEDTVAFEPEVVVQSRSGMLLDDEQQRPVPGGRHRRRGLGCGREGSFGSVFAEGFFRHAGILLRSR